MTSSLAQLLADHWYILLAAWWAWRYLQDEKRARADADRLRREEERKEREDERVEIRAVTREVVREELAAHVKDETAEFSRFREDVRRELAGIGDLVRQHDQRIRDLETR